MNRCVNVRDLTFVIGEDEYRGLGSISFIVMQEFIEGVASLKELNGVFIPKDAKSADKILEAINQDKKIVIKGRFKDTLNRNEELDWLLLNVLFSQVKFGESASFHAVASDYLVGTFT